MVWGCHPACKRSAGVLRRNRPAHFGHVGFGHKQALASAAQGGGVGLAGHAVLEYLAQELRRDGRALVVDTY